MGYIAHHSIVVSSWNSEPLTKSHEKAVALGLPVSAIVAGWMNGGSSFFVAPDGSKEGWKHSDRGDELRADLISFMDSLAYSDGSTPLSWVEVCFSPDDQSATITNHAWKRKSLAERRAAARRRRQIQMTVR